MNNEQPIQFPPDLEEDWNLAQMTTAPTEPNITIPDEYRQASAPIAELYIPTALHEVLPDSLETDTDKQQLLYAVAAERPDTISSEIPDNDEIEETRYTLAMMSRNFSHNGTVHTALWARRVGFMLAGVPFTRASKIHRNFQASLGGSDNQKIAAIESSVAEYKSDETLQQELDMIVAFMTNIPGHQEMARDIINHCFAQIEHWRNVQAARMTKHVIRRLEHEPTMGFAEASREEIPAAGASRFSPEDLSPSPLGHFIDTEQGQLIPSQYADAEMTDRGRVMKDMLALWQLKNLVMDNGSSEVVRTRKMLDRIGASGDPRVTLAHWMRHIVFRNAGVSFEHAAAASELYTRNLEMSSTKWSNFALELKKKHVPRNGDMDQLINSLMQLVGVPSSAEDFCKRIVAMSIEELENWQRVTEFESEINLALEKKYWLRTLLGQLRKSEEIDPSPLHEPGYTPRLWGLAATKYVEADLEQLPMDTIVDGETGKIVPSVTAESQRSENARMMMDFAATVKKLADESVKQFSSYTSHSELITRKLVKEPNASENRTAHHARFMAFALASVNYGDNHWQVHRHGNTSDLPKKDVQVVVESAVEAVYSNVEFAERLEICLPFIAKTDQEIKLARKIICLTILEIRNWQAHQLAISEQVEN